jgi:ATP-binding cassette, subfamily B, bacterial
MNSPSPPPDRALSRLRLGIRLARTGAPRLFDALLAVQVIAALAVAGSVQAIALLTTALLDASPGDAYDVSSLLRPVGLLLLAVTVASVCETWQPAIASVLGERLAGVTTSEVLAAAGTIDLADFDRPDVLDRLKRVEVGAMIRPAQLAGGLGILLSGSVGAVALTLAVLTLQPWLALAAVLAAVPLWWAAQRDGACQYESIRGLSRLERRRMYLAGLLTSRDRAGEIRALELAPVLLERYQVLSRERCAEVARTAVERARRQLAARAVGGGLLLLGVLAMVAMLHAGTLSIPDAVAAGAAGAALRGRLTDAAAGIRALQEAAEFVDDHAAVTRTSAGKVRREPIHEMTAIEPLRDMSLRHVSMFYPGMIEPALRDVGLDLRVGEVVALVGANGSGKSTLAAIVAGLLTPTTGVVARNGADLRDLPAQTWRPDVSVLLQDPGRYQESLRDNVSFGAVRRPVDDDAVRDCLASAGADFLLVPDDTELHDTELHDTELHDTELHDTELHDTELHDTELHDTEVDDTGLDTHLGREQDGGFELSGGQWQRVALARTFYRGGRLLILDEPSSALDPMAERDLVDRLRRSFTERAVLLITHRMAAARIADRVVVLDHGSIIEQGKPTELLLADGPFARLCDAQTDLWEPQSPGLVAAG